MFRKVSVWPAKVIKLNHFPPFTPVSRAVNIRSVQIDGSTHCHLGLASTACLAIGTLAVLSSISLSFTDPPSFLAFAPHPLQVLLRSYACSDFQQNLAFFL